MFYKWSWGDLRKFSPSPCPRRKYSREVFCLISSLEVFWGTHHNLHIPNVLIYLNPTCKKCKSCTACPNPVYRENSVLLFFCAFCLIFIFGQSSKATLPAFLQNNTSPSIAPWQFISRYPIFPLAILWSFSHFKVMQVTSLLINVPSKIFHFVMASSCSLCHWYQPT